MAEEFCESNPDFLSEYIELREQIGELELAAETTCNCDSDNFYRCSFHERIDELGPRFRWLEQTFVGCWATLLYQITHKGASNAS